MRKVGRFGLAIALILTTFTFVSAQQVAHAAVGDTDTSVSPDGSHWLWSGSSTLTEYDSGTVEVWVKSSAACSGQTVLFGTNDVFLGCYNNVWETGILGGSTWTDSIQTESDWTNTMPILPRFQSNTWTHLAISWNQGGNYLLYYNGQLSQTITTTLSKTNSAGYLYIGEFGNGQQWNGKADDFNYYKGVRTQSQIQADMNATPTLSDPNLLAAYNFNEVSGTVVNRATGASSFGTNADLSYTAGTSFVENSNSDTVVIPGYTVVKFTKPYLNSNGGWKVPANITNVDYLVAGGGGGAGWNSGGGGSGGGVVSGTNLNVSGNVQVKIGVGGGPGYNTVKNGTSGFSSQFGSTTASGGNGGYYYADATYPAYGGTSVQSSGAGGRGSPNNSSSGLAGGDGPINSISGTNTNYGGGGGGGGWGTTTIGGAGGAGGGGAGSGNGSASTHGTFGSGNTGGGGGSGSVNASSSGNGGSGVVIIRYKNYFGASVTIAVNPKKTTKSAGATAITASTTSASGTITFYANGRMINGCKNLTVSGSSATCNWRPMVQGSVTLTATFTPSGDATLSGSVSSAAITTAVTKRTSAR